MSAKKRNRNVVLLASSIVLGMLQVGVSAEPSWVHLWPPEPPPSPRLGQRLGHAMAYDSCRDVVVLYGGKDGSITLEDTWEWDGDRWTCRCGESCDKPACGPGPRSAHTMAFDEDRCVTVLFGGNDAVGNYLNDTWEWDGTAWTQRCDPCPPPTRNGAGMAYDSTGGVILLFGGYSPGLLNDTWQWDGITWTEVSTTTPPTPRSWVAMAYDRGRDRTVVFGGNLVPVTCPANSDETWELNMSTSPDATWSLVCDPGSGCEPSPSARLRPLMVYDSARSVMVLFGGTDYCTSVFGDTWEYDGSTWSPIATPTAPSPRHFHVLAFDAAREEVLLFGGMSNPIAPVDMSEILGDTWSYGTRPPIPTVSEWGLIVMTLLLLIAGTLVYTQRRTAHG